MRSATPKQFMLLGHKPILMHTLERFHSFDPAIDLIVVLPSEYHTLWKSLCNEHSFIISHQVVAGGRERFHSVRAGLIQVIEEGMVAIHDGVRPLVSHDTIRRCFDEAEAYGNAVPYVMPADSVRIAYSDGNRVLPRDEVRLIQTPQVFHSGVIIKAYDCEYDPAFTDDAAVAERSGVMIHLVPGNRENIKITTPEDLAVAETFITLTGNRS